MKIPYKYLLFILVIALVSEISCKDKCFIGKVNYVSYEEAIYDVRNGIFNLLKFWIKRILNLLGLTN